MSLTERGTVRLFVVGAPAPSRVEDEDTQPDASAQASQEAGAGPSAAAGVVEASVKGRDQTPPAREASETQFPSGERLRGEPDDDEPVLHPGDRVGDLEIVRLVARGGMGEVHEAYHPRMDQRLAVKVMLRRFHTRADWVERFSEEGKLLAAYSQQEPGVVQIRNVGFDPRCGPYISMEWLVGKSLRELLSGWGGALPVGQAVLIAISLADVTHRVHALGLVHRDLKPENVFLEATTPPRLKLLDLGISKRVGAERTTEQNRTLGTVEYMSPEQLEHGRATAQSDQFAIAHILYEMLNGGHAFQERMLAALRDGGEERRQLVVITGHLHIPAEPLDRDLAPTIRLDDGSRLSLSAIVARGMSREAHDRYPSLADFAADLELWLTAYRKQRPADSGELVLDLTSARRPPRAQADSVARFATGEVPAAPPGPTAPPTSMRVGGRVSTEPVELTDFVPAYSLIVTKEDGDMTERYPLLREVVVLGRDAATADIVLAHPTVSRTHCELRHVAPGVFQVVDLGSTQGVWIGEIKAKSGVLRSRDQLTVGSIAMRLCSPGCFRKKRDGGWMFVPSVQALPPEERATVRMVGDAREPGGPILSPDRVLGSAARGRPSIPSSHEAPDETVARPASRALRDAAGPFVFWLLLFVVLGLAAIAGIRMLRAPEHVEAAPAATKDTGQGAPVAAPEVRPGHQVAAPQATAEAAPTSTSIPTSSSPAPQPALRTAQPRPRAPTPAPRPTSPSAARPFEPEAL